MEIELIKSDTKFSFSATNGEVSIPVCAAPSMEEGNSGFRPMQLLLVGLASCMSIDVLNILYKQRQEIASYQVKVASTRKEGIPSVFEEIDLHFYLKGNVDEKKLQRAIELGEEKYCSVHIMLSKTAKINCKYTIENV